MCTILVVLVSTTAMAGDLPEPLLRMLENRETLFDTAQIEWSHETSSPEVPKSHRYYTSRYAGSDYLLVDFGDENGCQRIDACKDGLAMAYSENRILFRWDEQDQWMHRRDDIGAGYSDPGAEYFHHQPDPRSFGLLPELPGYHTREHLSVPSVVEMAIPDDAAFETRVMPDGKYAVTMSSEGGAIKWMLDPDVAWQPVSVERFHLNRGQLVPVRIAEMEYAPFGDRWFLKQATFRDDRTKRETVVRVRHARFDEPDLQEGFELAAALEMLPGTNLTHHRASGSGVLEIFDGERGVTTAEMNARILDRDWPDSSAFLELVNRWKTDAPGKKPYDFYDVSLARSKSVGLWEPYTRQFILRAALNEAQEEEAWRILAQCQQLARDMQKKDAAMADGLRNTEAEISKVTLQLRKDATDPAEKQAAIDRLRQLEERRGELAAPLDAIFEQRLQPGLDRLLTPEQRRRMQQRDAQRGAVERGAPQSGGAAPAPQAVP